MRIALLLLLLVHLSRGQYKAAHARRITQEAQIAKTLSTRANPDSRPPVRETADHSAIVVLTSLFINRIEWDTPKGAEVDLFLRQQWEDSRLAFEVDPREEMSEITLPESVDIWTPDTYISSGREKSIEDSRESIIVESSGHVRSSELRLVTVSPTTSSSSPFSPSRSFTIRLSSYKYPIEDVVYLWANSPPQVVPVEVSPELLTGRLQFEHAVAGDCVGNYTVGIYSCIDVVVTFTGSFWSNFSRFFLPTTLLLVFSWLHMWLHGSWSVPRSLSACLPFAIFACIFLFHRPACYQSAWLVFCLILSFLSLVEYFLVLCCGLRKTIRLPTHTDTLANNANNVTNSVADATNTSCTAAVSPLDAIGRLAFPVIFLLFVLLFAILF